MSVRRQNSENALGTRRPHLAPLHKKVIGTKENNTPAREKPKSLFKPSKDAVVEDGKPSTTARRALTNLTNSTPQSRTVARQPLSTKPGKQPLIARKPVSVSTTKARPSTFNHTLKTPSTNRTIKRAISVYTPAAPPRPNTAAEEDVDEVEYMPPRSSERPYEPPSPMRPRAEDDLFAVPVEPVLDLDVQLDQEFQFQLANLDSPARRFTASAALDLNENMEEFQFDL